jgi:hypothetical protein
MFLGWLLPCKFAGDRTSHFNSELRPSRTACSYGERAGADQVARRTNLRPRHPWLSIPALRRHPWLCQTGSSCSRCSPTLRTGNSVLELRRSPYRHPAFQSPSSGLLPLVGNSKIDSAPKRNGFEFRFRPLYRFAASNFLVYRFTRFCQIPVQPCSAARQVGMRSVPIQIISL